MAATKLMTIEDLDAMEGEEAWYERLYGQLIETAPTGARHGSVAYRIITLIDRFGPSRELV